MQSINTIARQIVLTTSLTDPDEIADMVLAATPDDDLRDAYRQALRGVAVDALRTTRHTAGTTAAPAAPNRSAKVAAIRAHHLDYYEQRVNVNGEWKMLGDCTLTDVRTLAHDYTRRAAENRAKAAEYTALADRMEQAGAKTVRQIEAVAA